jgi:hypothetical protein
MYDVRCEGCAIYAEGRGAFMHKKYTFFVTILRKKQVKI